jgi:hypothetical protein
MLIGNDMGDMMGNKEKPICKDTKKRIHHYLHKKNSYQPEFNCQICIKNISFN